MTTPAQCPRCGATLPPATPAESCPKCLIQLGLGKSEPGIETKTSVGLPGQPAPEPSELAQDFPQLEILELLGQGGMGVVYKARQKTLDRLVALKILSVPESAGPDFAERFLREARALASLSHPSIVTVYDFGRSGDRYYLLMEYVDGADLHRMIRGGEIEPSQALQLVSRICEALQFAHESGIVHRDIKPENILVDKKGRVKIADFGLAKMLGRAADPTRLTGAHQVMGTAHYMAPEQLERPLEVDHRADIYSLGVVFYELLTGELPLGRFQPPSRKIHVDVRVDDVVLKTLEKEPQLRYQHVSELRTDVDGIQSGAKFAPSATGTSTDGQKPAGGSFPGVTGFFQARARWWIVIAAVVVFLVANTLWVLGDRLDRPVESVTNLSPARGIGTGESAIEATESAVDAVRSGIEAIEPTIGTGGSTVESGETGETGAGRRRSSPPLTIAAARGQERIVISLLDSGADVNARDRHGETALLAAVDNGSEDLVQLFLDRGADVNTARENGTTALIIAAARGNQRIVEILLDAGANASAADKHGTTPLSAAVDGSHHELTLLLLDRGADASAARGNGVTPLMIAAARGQRATVEMLLDRGADASAADRHGETALGAAVDGSHTEIVRFLLDRGADANAARRNGITPLMIAAARGQRTLVEMLLDAGADTTAEGRDGTTALSAAVDGSHEEIVDLLLSR